MPLTPEQLSFKERLVQATDSLDIEAWGEFFAEDMELQFGNFPVVKGKSTIKELLGNQCASLQSMRHETINHWWIDGTFFHESRITNVLKGDDKEIVLLGMLIGDVDLKTQKFKNNRVYLNNTPLVERMAEMSKL